MIFFYYKTQKDKNLLVIANKNKFYEINNNEVYKDKNYSSFNEIHENFELNINNEL